MKKSKLLFTFIALIVTLPVLAIAGNPPVPRWTVKNPFEQKVFIENKGQYNLQGQLTSNDILFGARQDGLQYYFTRHSIWIERGVPVKRTDEEMEQIRQSIVDGGIDADNPSSFKTVEEFHQMEFAGSDPSAEITTESEVNWYYNFTIGKNVPVVAHAYKKLTYLNLYPGIDMEFYFPEDKQGFEYSFIVHPGADISQLKIQYPLNEGLKLTAQGNMVIQSGFGEFNDHEPVATQAEKNITCSYSLHGNDIQFNVNAYDKTQLLLIDPWTKTPTFSGTNSAYDVDWDNDGNCYAYGGSAPWQLVKYNSSGVMQWSFTEDFTSGYPYYGGFAVDRGSRSSYLIEGFNTPGGAGIIKLSSSGAQISMFAGDSSFREMWRIAFSRCTNQAVIGGGGTSSPSFQVCYLDTNVTGLSPVNVLNNTQECCHDMWGIALDNFGNCYTATVNTPFTSDYENIILKLPLPSLSPTTWSVNDGYNFHEAQSVDYAYGVSSPGNAFNGMTVGDSDLYTYDSYILKKWSVQTGALLSSATVNSTINNAQMHWGGLTSNDCGDIFLGSKNNIIHYSSDIVPIDTTAVADTVFDVKLGRSNILYTCGAGFISVLQVNVASCALDITVTNQVTNATCTIPATVSINPVGGTPPYSITWNTTPPQTGTTLTNPVAGTYVATIVDNSCSGQGTVLDTIMITSPGSSIVDIPSAFTPDIMGVNAIFKPNLFCDSYTGYEFRVYNRWGRMVFESTTPDVGWDGKYNGQPQPMDVYVYYIKFTCGTCNAFKKGDVTLVK